MTAPLVSVLVPAYRAEAYLAETLESVLAQTWPNLEVVVVDDGSPDGTLEVARRFEPRGVRVVAQGGNRGQTATLNRALAEMSPDTAFVQYLDADDTISPNKIEAQVRRLLAEPPGTLATCSWARFYNGDPASAVFKTFHDHRDYPDPLGWLVDDWTGRGTMPPGAWLYPRAVVDAVGPWHEGLSLNNDMEYFTRACLAASGIAFVPEARLYYRSGHANLSGRRDAAAMASQREVIRLSTGRLLAREDSPRTRHASACYWQSLAFMAFPDHPALVAEAEARAAELGGGTLTYGVARPFRPVRDLVGWKPAARLNRLWNRLRHG
ncbi:MAG: glycosyltransferase family 2 protein [Hyphomonas sp.]